MVKKSVWKGEINTWPKEINQIKASSMFPEWPRIISRYITEKTKNELITKITKLSTPNKYIKDFQAYRALQPLASILMLWKNNLKPSMPSDTF